MTTVLVTGAKGFIGSHLTTALRRRADTEVLEFHRGSSESEFAAAAEVAEVVYHLAGVNRPADVQEFATGNAGWTERLCDLLRRAGRRPHVVFASSIQAELDNPYGRSKRQAEDILRRFARETDSTVAIYRLRNVFGPGCRPHYNSVTATFCHSIAHDLPIHVTDPDRSVELVHVSDVVAALETELNAPPRSSMGVPVASAIPFTRVTLQELAGKIQFFREMQQSQLTPDFSQRFHQQLYATYLAYCEPAQCEYGLEIREDDRGSLAEFIKSPWFGQIFVSRTRPGVTRGNHYHLVKAEKFLVLSGDGLIRSRLVGGTDVSEYPVRGEEYRVVDIPPNHTHSITNVGSTELITLFWASEIFDPDHPDTYYLPVDQI